MKRRRKQNVPQQEPCQAADEELTLPDRIAKHLERGAEPYWMQDIRLAQRRLDEARARLRSPEGRAKSSEEKGS
jgi:hypothetical protein